jgi:hypothetical protein
MNIQQTSLVSLFYQLVSRLFNMRTLDVVAAKAHRPLDVVQRAVQSISLLLA